VALGSTSIYETQNRAATWASVFGPIANAPAVTALAYAPSNDLIVYAGYSNGKVYRSNSTRTAWVDASGGTPWGSPYRVSGLIVDPLNPDIAYIAVPTFRTGRVWKTNNGGTSWTDISGLLPVVPANSLALDPRNGTLFAGLDIGVWATQDSGVHWYRFGAGLPNAQVLDLTLNTTTNIVGAATHGRSAFVIGIMPGDLNGDGVVNTADAVTALQIAGGLRVGTADEYIRGNLLTSTPGITVEDAAAIARKARGL
jgi:hypothetical protein